MKMKIIRKKRSPIYLALSIIFVYIGIFLSVYSIISMGIREYKLISSFVLCCFSGISFLNGLREVLEGRYIVLGYLSLIMGPISLIFGVWSILTHL